jgi:hypothetical protein
VWKDVEEFYVFTAIILSTTYAAFCRSLCTDIEEESINALIEVAIDVEMVSDLRKRKQLAFWFQQIVAVTSYSGKESVTSSSWIESLFNIFTGGDAESSTNVPYDAFGYYKNGIFIVSDLLLRPSIQPEALIRCHIQRGQPMQVPVNENGFVVAHGEDRLQTSNVFNSDALPVVTVLQSRQSDTQVRIDLEPHWEGDPRKVIFRVRAEGRLKCSFSPERLASSLISTEECDGPLDVQIVRCECDSPSIETPLSSSQTWKSMEVSQLLAICSKSTSATDLFDGPKPGTSVCIHAGGDMAAQVLCLVCFRPPVTFASRCLKCGYAFWDGQRGETPDRLLARAMPRWTGHVLVDGLDTQHQSRSEYEL